MVAVSSTTKHARHGQAMPPAERTSTRARGRAVSLRTFGIVSGTLAGLLTLDALVNEQTRFDVRVINEVQRVDAPFLHEAVTAISTLTASEGAILMWALTFIAFAVTRWWLPALATLTLPIGGVLNQIVGELLVERTRPDPGVVTRTVADIQAASFPSGHVMGAVMLYGFLLFVATRIDNRALRLAIQIPSAIVIVAIGFVRVWEGAHWPTDVLGAYAYGGLFLAVLFAAYGRIEALAGHLPFVHAGELEHDEAQAHAHALTSVVIFRDGEVAKVYNPGFLPRALYWLSFQAPFPYERNRDALRAAAERRNLAALLTEYWYGEARVARVTGIEPAGDRWALVSEFVDGHAPSDREDAKRFLRDLRARFEQAGLPTWQIDPRQPRAIDNLLETPNGYAIVDLESGLAAPLASLTTWRRAIRRGHVPLFDTVFYDITRAYVAREADAMRERMGAIWLAELELTLDAAEHATAAWYASEPRLWSVLAQPKTWKRRLAARFAGSQEKALGWMTASVEQWHAEGRITDDEAVALRAEMETPQFQAVLPHLGVHLVMSILLRFPLGSIARAGWSLWALGAATLKLMLRRSDRHAFRQSFSIHNPLVIAIAAIPGFGTFAYLASGPIRSNRLLMRVTVDAVMFKLPWRLYERSGMRRVLVIGRATGSRAGQPRPEPAVTAAPQPVAAFEPVAESGFGPAPVPLPLPLPVPVAAMSYAPRATPRAGYLSSDVAAWD